MAAQVERGHDLAYFFTGRHFARPSRPWMRRWQRGEIAMHEVINGPIVSGLELGTRYPELDLNEPYLEKVRRHAYKVVDADIVALREAGWSEDALFEATVAAALGEGLRRLELGLKTLG